MSELVSVLMATYNGSRFVAQAVESVLNQTHPAVELIVCDDGSTDDTREVLEAFGERIRVVRQENGGVSSARNEAARHARGRYLAFLDQDDAYLPDAIEEQLEFLSKRPDCAYVYADSEVVDAEERVHGRRSRSLRFREGAIFEDLLAGNFIPLETMLFRADAFHRLGGFRTDLSMLEDWDLCLRAARNARVACRAEVVARYRIHDANLSHDREALVLEYARVLDELAGDETLEQKARVTVQEERRRRHGELAWYALRRADREGVRDWLVREPQARRSLKLTLLWPLVQVVPRPLTKAVLTRLPRRKLYGV